MPVNVKSTSLALRRSQLPNVASFYALFPIVGTPSNSVDSWAVTVQLLI